MCGDDALSLWLVGIIDDAVAVVLVVVVPDECSGCRSIRRFERVSAVVSRFLNRALITTLSPIDTRWVALPPLHGGRVEVVVDRIPVGRVDEDDAGRLMPHVGVVDVVVVVEG